MVDLPRTRVSEITRGTQSTVSGNEIRSAFGQLAAGLDALGQDFEAASVEMAQDEGAGAVYRNDKGDLVYDQRSPLSRAGRAFNRAAQVAFVSKVSMEARSALAQIEAESNGDVATFDKTAAEYQRNLLKGKDKLVKGALDLEIGGLIVSARTGMIASQQARDIKTQKETIETMLDLVDDDAAGLARTGGTGTVEYAQKRDSIRTLLNELTANPQFGFTPKQAEIMMRRIESRHQAEGIIGTTERIFKEKGLKAAEDFAGKAFNDPSLSLTPVERRAYQNHAESALRAFKGDMAIERQEARIDAKVLTDTMAAGQQVDDDDVYDIARRLSSSGDASGAFRLLRKQSIAKSLFAFSRLSDGEQARQLGFGLSGGLDEYVDRVIGAESSGVATAKNPRSTATGGGQFIDKTWLEMVKAKRPDLAKGKGDAQILAMRKDLTLSREMTRAYGEDNAKALQAAGHAATAGNLYLAHFAGPGGAVKILNADEFTDISEILSEDAIKANPFLAGRTAGDVVEWARMKIGGIDPVALKSMRAEVANDARSLWNNMKEGLKKGDPLGEADWGLLEEQLRLTGDQDFYDEVANYLKSSGLVGFPQGSMEAMRAGITDMEQGGVTADERDVYDAKLKIYDETREGLQKDPLLMASRRGVIPALSTIENMSDPNSFAIALGTRQRAARTVEQNYGAEAVPALTSVEIDTVASMLGKGSVEQSAQILGVMAQALDDDTYMATMAKIAEKTSPALAVAGALYVRNPHVAESILQGTNVIEQNPGMESALTEKSRDAAEAFLPYLAFAPGMDEARNGLLGAIWARYAHLSAQAGDISGKVSTDNYMASGTRFARAVREVTGGVLEYNGRPIIAPRYGMSQVEFDALIRRVGPAALQGAQVSNGTPIPAHSLNGNIVLRSWRDGQYLVQLVNSSASGVSDESAPYAVGPSGEPFIFDLRPAPSGGPEPYRERYTVSYPEPDNPDLTSEFFKYIP